jgi:hypothetical protein
VRMEREYPKLMNPSLLQTLCEHSKPKSSFAGLHRSRSSLPGHAMRACSRARMPGAIIGKALRGLAQGRALVPILLALG